MQLLAAGEASLLISVTNLVFNWTAYEDGLYYSYSGFCSFVVFLGVFPLLQSLYKKYNIQVNKAIAPLFRQEEVEADSLVEEVYGEEQRNILEPAIDVDTMAAIKMDVSFLFGAGVLYLIASFIVPLFKSVPAIFVTEAIESIASIGNTVIRSLSTTIIPAHHTGMVLGAITVSDAMANAIGSLLYSSVFAYTSATKPWFYYYVSSGISTVALLIMSTVWMSYSAP
ncbi:hypothetical protein BGX28_010415 [Mortierella sp. GBA30]|nr:hypothetical protein BGX28_010415 [Mortierella sp. GBA30]